MVDLELKYQLLRLVGFLLQLFRCLNFELIEKPLFVQWSFGFELFDPKRSTGCWLGRLSDEEITEVLSDLLSFLFEIFCFEFWRETLLWKKIKVLDFVDENDEVTADEDSDSSPGVFGCSRLLLTCCFPGFAFEYWSKIYKYSVTKEMFDYDVILDDKYLLEDQLWYLG